ncbi:MAG TPA: sulfatase-like hydrolase/transferase [Myxococcota bacterium]
MRRQLSWLLIFVAASIMVTWPFAFSPGRAPSQHSDYVQNIWNVWWVHEALVNQGISPNFTTWLQFPSGVSLARHTLSPLNSVPASLTVGSLGFADTFKLLLLIHFALSGWAMALLAYELTRHRGGAILAGLVYSFCPYHFYYLAQINLATMELIPLALWLTVRSYREPGIAAPLGLALCAGLLAASCSYYLVYAGLCCAYLAAGGRIWAPEAPIGPGLKRLAWSGGLAVVCVAAAATPLIVESLRATAVATFADPEHAARRSNDLLGFVWVGPPERILLSWPSTFGYAALGIAALGFRARRAQFFWLGLLFLSWLLSLGPTLHISGRDTSVPLPAAWLSDLPLLSMLRKPDRFVVVSQLALAVLCAQASVSIAQWRRPRLQRAMAVVAPLLVLVEFGGRPLLTFEDQPPAYAEVAAKLEAAALIELPIADPESKPARDMRAQLTHGKPIAQGYVTSLALSEHHFAQARRWESVQRSLLAGSALVMREELEKEGIELVVLHKTQLLGRTPSKLDGRLLWAPFVFLRGELLPTRQLGGNVAQPWDWQRAALALEAQLGPALHDDADAQIYALRSADLVKMSRKEQRPNVVLIVVDTLRRDRLGTYGNRRNTSPNLDALAKTSVQYDDWFSPSSWTTPAVASLLTSLYPTRLQIGSEASKLQEQFITLPEILRAHGYRTGAVISNTFLTARWGFAQGFESFDDNLAAEDKRSITSPSVTDKAAAFLKLPDGRPFFLYLHYFDPHADYMGHPDSPEPSTYHGALEPGIGPLALRELAGQGRLGPEDLRFATDLYDGEVAFTDRSLAGVLESLHSEGVFDDTLIVFTSDHGEEFLDHGNFGHARTLFDELIRVPMIIKFPRQTEGAVSTQLAGHVDLLPTILEILKIDVDHEISGVSVLPKERSVDDSRTIFSETNRGQRVRAVIWKNFKLIYDMKSDGHRLFDLLRDPKETRDVQRDHQATATRLRDELRGWMRQEEANAAAPASVEMTEDEKARLRSLGYLR